MAEHGQQAHVDLLEAIMQELLDARQTGILTIQRSKAGVRDVGTITLLYGEPVEAHAGERVGDDAIQWLYTWGRCQCTFLPQAATELVISPPPPPVEVEAPVSPLAFLARLRIGRNQEANESSQKNKPGDLDIPKRPEKADRLDEPVIEQQPFTPDVAISQARTIPVTSITPLTPPPPSFQMGPAQPPLRTPTSDANLLFPEWSYDGNRPRQQAPQRLWHGQDALMFLERTQASRLHRHIFLLLDGKRTLPDLVRITGHSPEEIKRLLNDLERLGMIKQEYEARAQY